MKQCASCGSELRDQHRFCPLCGLAASSEILDTRTIAISDTPSLRTPSSSRSGLTSSASSDGSRFPPGTFLASRYRIIAMLGRGGMGEVYRADDLTLGQQVALKFLPAAVAANPQALDRFRNEVRVARRVSHSNVCRVYDMGEFEGDFFLSMEYVDGEDLGSLLRRIGRLPADKALEIARKLCAGLAAAHAQGVLHRDLKPANVMLDARGHVLLTDFGLAGLADQIAGAEVRNGTPAYMAPEQLSGKEVTVRSDIYSLGLVLYEILTGKRPHESDTLAGLEQARRDHPTPSPSTIVKDIDPAVERVIMRCLDPDPARRPASALAVAAALPGGDPLAAALAAGETPTPEMVAAAGEGSCATFTIASIVLAAIVVILGIESYCQYRLNALDKSGYELPIEVLRQRAKDLLARIGYANKPVDDAIGFDLDGDYFSYAERNGNRPEWSKLLAQRPPALIFEYRQSEDPMIPSQYHDDKLTPGLIQMDDPPFTTAGMINLRTDQQGRLISFEAMPPEILDAPLDPAKGIPLVDWNALFAVADLDPQQFTPAEPERTWLATSDVRAAWTGKWPGSGFPLRVEGAALRGKPVAFLLISPWTRPGREPDNSSISVRDLLLSVLIFTILVAAGVLAYRHFRQNRGDRRGAAKLAVFIFIVEMATWLFRGHFAASAGLLMPFFMALCSASFYALLLWAIYMAVEPYIRRYWPQGVIGWSNISTGQWRDPIVGRDVLYGAGFAVLHVAIDRGADLWRMAIGGTYNFGNVVFLEGMRHTLGRVVMGVPDSIRTALVFLLIMLLLRVLLRNQWIAAAAWVGIFLALQLPGTAFPLVDTVATIVTYGLFAFVLTRFGLLAFAAAAFVNDLLVGLPITFNTGAPYFDEMMVVIAIVLALSVWGFRVATSGAHLAPSRA